MTYTVAVRELCEFTAKQGSLDLRFSPSPSAQEGIVGHLAVRSRRASDYEAEISLNGAFGALQVRGRADGYDPRSCQLEEIKTYRGDLERIPENHRFLHWAQLKVYGYLFCEQRGLEEIQLALVYYEIGTQQESVLIERHTRETLRIFFEDQCSRFLVWAEQEMAHRAARDAALLELGFPYPDFRAGQRQLAEAVYKAAGSGRPLLAQAPTGIGKTIGSLFPLMKACAVKKLDKIFFLTAKTSGRRIALDAIDKLRGGNTKERVFPLRVVELVARGKACEHPDKACHGDSCPLAKGFYDRLPHVRKAALDSSGDKAALRAAALEHDICPYYLSQDMVRWADIVVADYNYYFDGSALLHALAAENDWKTGILVDEAHNLVSRAREMYSATLDQGRLKTLRSSAPPELKKSLDRLNRSWNALQKGQEEQYRVYPEISSSFDNALRNVLSSIMEYLAQNPAHSGAELQSFYFDLLHFSGLLEAFGDHSMIDVTMPVAGSKTGSSILCIRNVVPAPHLATRFGRASAATLFSATLSPWNYYCDMLGVEDPLWIDVDSPFRAEQLQVHIARQISTRFRDREKSVSALVNLMARQYDSRPGNYLAFFSSFEYLRQVCAAMASQKPEIPIWDQSSRMSEDEREAFIDRFRPGGKGIGFAVLGGAFGEGIDLPGDRLIGAFIATLGMPQVNQVNREMAQRIDALLGDGYAYTYTYPGIQKVIQAAGRVIRTTSDTGIVHLMDDRFGRQEVISLLPRWWDIG
ncbi:ATP-dependent DNA helicase [Oxalobacteraceae bacterium R-40]|uniref:ATP-dependent DNA helicase n=1 Tax=Keguizhuia sedimenti TaxID=3064264 RepID=A0ABU1BT65_9BURK|nr:ATP-dependent DNA helicase [Oxalobacteraceae bacterium R-40]